MPGCFGETRQHSGVYDAAGVRNFQRREMEVSYRGHGDWVSGGRGEDVYFGSTDGNFYAVDAESGAQKWKFEAQEPDSVDAGGRGEVVYFGAYDGNFYAVDAATGALKWKFKTGGRETIRGQASARCAAGGRDDAGSV